MNLFIFCSYNLIGKWYDALDHRFDATNFMVWHKTNPTPKFFKTGFLNSCETILKDAVLADTTDKVKSEKDW